MKKKTLALIFFVLGIALALVVYRMLWQRYESKQENAAYHAHANFQVVINGSTMDFNRPDFMSLAPCDDEESFFPLIHDVLAHGKDSDELRENVHLHDNVGDVVHVHKRGMTWHNFFESLNMDLEKDQFVDEQENAYVNNKTSQLFFFLNGKQVNDLGEMEIHDLDRVLVVYDQRGRAVSELLKTYVVADTACQYSGTCPTRGSVGQESCTTGVKPTWYEKLLFPKAS